MDKPEQIVPEQAGRKAYQSRVDFGEGRIFLPRAIVQDDRSLPVVVTANRTIKIAKYWETT